MQAPRSLLRTCEVLCRVLLVLALMLLLILVLVLLGSGSRIMVACRWQCLTQPLRVPRRSRCQTRLLRKGVRSLDDCRVHGALCV